jgi:hypothetical protein
VHPLPNGNGWVVHDDKRRLYRRVRPHVLPGRVREVVVAAGAAYYHAVVDGDRIAFEKRYIGDPGWR